MCPDPRKIVATRPLTDQERELARWMLEHGTPEAKAFLVQLDRSDATTYKCPCGCATLNFKVADLPEAPPGVHVLADFMYGSAEDPKGVFIYEKEGILSGLEVFGYGGEHPTTLPKISELRPVSNTVTA